MYLIEARNVGKKFHIGFNQNKISMQNLYYAFSGREHQREFWALRDVNFKLKKGELLGIVGRNGSGKSTLLSVIAGVFRNDTGNISVNGRVISVIGLVNGFKDRLTARDNIVLATALYGQTARMNGETVKSIIKFAELDNFVDTKLYQYSTGMIARLVFSIAVHSKPSILLLDEVTSNLDKEFTKIVGETIKNLTDKGVGVIVVSHQRKIIEQCDRALIIEAGRCIREGTSRVISNSYFTADS